VGSARCAHHEAGRGCPATLRGLAGLGDELRLDALDALRQGGVAEEGQSVAVHAQNLAPELLRGSRQPRLLSIAGRLTRVGRRTLLHLPRSGARLCSPPSTTAGPCHRRCCLARHQAAPLTLRVLPVGGEWSTPPAAVDRRAAAGMDEEEQPGARPQPTTGVVRGDSARVVVRCPA
jgi:hypothetical protein